MSTERKFAIIGLVALWSVIVYSLVWLAVSTFVSADVVSHYYSDIYLSRWWGVLFVPLYLEIIVAIYLFLLPQSRYNCLLFLTLAVGLAFGIFVNFLGTGEVVSNVVWESSFILAGLTAVFACGCILVNLFIKLEDALLFLCFSFLSVVLGAATGAGLFWGSILTYFAVLMCGLAALVVGYIVGVLVGVSVALLVKFLIRLHKLALGLGESKEEDDEEEE